MADGVKIENKRCLVDVERGRAVPGWRPRRLGGGKGGEMRAPRPPKSIRRQVRLGIGTGGLGVGCVGGQRAPAPFLTPAQAFPPPGVAWP